MQNTRLIGLFNIAQHAANLLNITIMFPVETKATKK